MKKGSVILFITVVLTTLSFSKNLFAQKPDTSVPQEVLNELVTKELSLGGPLKMEYKVVYPENFDSTKTYPMVLGLSGGDQSEEIVNYCYYAWFRSELFKEYITVMPLAPSGQNFRDFKPMLIDKFFAEIVKVEPLTESNWIMIGTSNGGIAAFNFLKQNVKPFSKLAVIPGELQKVVSQSEGWEHLDVVVAVGENDNRWRPYTESAYNKLKPVVKSIQKVTLQGEGHIVSSQYDMDMVYNKLLNIKE